MHDDHISYQKPADPQETEKKKIPLIGWVVIAVFVLGIGIAITLFLMERSDFSFPNPSGSSSGALTKADAPVSAKDSIAIIPFIHSKIVVNGKKTAAVVLSMRQAAQSDSSALLESAYFLLPDSMVSRRLLLACPPVKGLEGWAVVRYRGGTPHSVELCSHDWYRLEKEYLPSQ